VCEPVKAIVQGEAERSPDGASDLGALARTYRLRAFHFALQLVGNRDDAMDVTQEAFLRLHRHWQRRDPERPFAPWLYSIVRNLAIDLHRRRATRGNQEGDVEGRDEGPGPEILAEQSEQKAAVWRAISALPGPLREVVILRHLHGLSYSEIAEAAGVPVTTVNNRLHDARERLRQQLQGCL
jgi:RNA polymerase sigma-70 factor, ECF subfamily